MFLPLEEWLQEKADKKPLEFPHQEHNYFELYKLQKEKFSTHIYPFVNEGMTAMDTTSNLGNATGTLYTDHGIKHVNAVIKTAGNLLGCRRKSSRVSFQPYEVYLLLMAILSHDAGNIEGRKDHQFKVYKLLNSPPTKVLNDGIEMREINDIAQTHTGKGLILGVRSKDTIVTLAREKTLGSIVYHPRRIAALLRFADEICEDRRRVPTVLLDIPEVAKGPSAPYLYFGNSIASVDILKDQQSINIQFELTPENVLNPLKFMNTQGQPEEKFLIDEILVRLGKIRRERAYCFRFLQGIIQFVKVTADINVVEETRDGNFKIHPLGIIDLSEEDYPSEKNDSFLKRHTEFSGETVQKQLSGTFLSAKVEDTA